MSANYLPFLVEYIPYNQNEQFSPGANCNAVTFLNMGTAPVTIENLIVLQQGQSHVIDGNLGEIFGKQSFNIAFGAGSASLVIIKKVYS